MRDLIIIGGGPAGYSAAIYAARYTLDTLLLTKRKGGRIVDSAIVENYPGYKKLSGYELMKKMEEHLGEYNVDVKEEEVIKLKKQDKTFTVTTEKGEYEAKAIIIATGWKRKKLGVPGEKRFEGKGVSYCATCDGPLFKEKAVAMIGGGPAACEDALILSDYAKKVYIIEILPEINPEPILEKKLRENPKIEIRTSTSVKEITGAEKVNGIILTSGEKIKVDGVFVEIGGIPQTRLVEDIGVRLNKKGEIIIDEYSRTNVDGIFAAGDVTSFPYKQAVVAAATGATAAWSAYFYLKKF